MPGIKKLHAEIMEIPLEKIILDMAPEVSEEMLNSVRNMGIFQEPIAVEEGNLYKVVAGRRRVVAASKNGATRIRVKVLRNGYDDIDIAKMILIENFQRSPNPISEAKAIDILYRDGGYPANEIAKMLGISKQKVFQRLQLLKLPDILIEGVADGYIPFSVARAILPMLPEDTSNGLGEPIERLTQIFDTTGKLTLKDVAEVKEEYFGRPAELHSFYEKAISKFSRSKLRKLAQMIEEYLAQEEDDGS